MEELAVESGTALTVTRQAEHADLGSLERVVAAALTRWDRSTGGISSIAWRRRCRSRSGVAAAPP